MRTAIFATDVFAADIFAFELKSKHYEKTLCSCGKEQSLFVMHSYGVRKRRKAVW